ncbi:hypothetical protein ACFQZ4_04050 [Catellatospora coxensis]|uniref:Uncharacterized protein n=1 Tax=Catellatospora coxensis TaxID=310354 RepID=A0A8J3P703_9ACTN|nr:hypothetical protein [Catellatospora coxensis]GIG06466.1 hypothetical protein Cco03nite_31660 [Catellatospora coxensis]
MTATCAFDGSPLTAAPLNSQLAGVLAGLVFAGMIVLISVQPEPSRLPSGVEPGRRTEALVLLVGSFLALLMAAFLFGVASGDTSCARGRTVVLAAGGLLGLGVLSMFGGLCWLIDQYDHESRRATRVTLFATYFVGFIVIFYLSATVRGYVDDVGAELARRRPDWLPTVINHYYLPVLEGITLLLLLRSLAGQYVRRPRTETSEITVLVTAYVYIAGVMIAGVVAVQATQLDPARPITPGYFTFATLTSIGAPALALVMQLLALPTGRSVSVAPQGGDAGQPRPAR